jgi:hypothetical protein
VNSWAHVEVARPKIEVFSLSWGKFSASVIALTK